MRIKIWHKMIIGIAIPSLIALLGGIFTLIYINNIKNRQEFVQIADDLKEHILEVRRNEKNFLYYKNEEHLRQVHSAISVVVNSINNIPPDIIKEIGQYGFSLLNDSIKRYSRSIDNLFDNFLIEEKDIGKVREEGRKLETIVAQDNHTSELTTSFILHLRLQEKNYMLFRDKKSFQQLNIALSNLNNFTPFCYKCIPYMDAVRGLFATYKKSETISNELISIGRLLETQTGKIALRERQRIDYFISKTNYLLTVALILLCTLGPFFVYKTSEYIVAPIRRLAEITEKIADGDLNLRAPIREHDETYSLAVSFNKMLDKLQLTYQSLEKSMELLNEKHAQLVDSEKRASLGLLVSGVAHELNNPLYNISLTAETMRDGLNEYTKEEMAELIQDVVSQGKRARNIIDDLLDFARARTLTVMEKQNIVNVLRESINLVANQMRMSNIDLKQKLPDKPVYISGNKSKLEQIFVSIFTNAIQAMKGKGTLSISVRPDDDKNVLIKISDTGQGIAKENIKNIFEPFYTTKPVGEGTGLGLSVCHSLVQEHNSEIEAESELGKGTTFTIKFPLYEEVVQSA